MEKFDYETFIALVEERKVLWDNSLEIYKDKCKSLKAWFEICHIMNENFEELPDTEKNSYGKLMAEKWKNLRDAWMECDKKMHETKSGSGAEPIHKYQYYDNLHFLKKNTQLTSVSGSNTPEEKSKSVDVVSTKRKNKEEMNPVDKKIMKFMKNIEKEEDNRVMYWIMKNIEKEEDNRVMYFFKGIASSVTRFRDEDIVEFQYQVLKIIRHIQNKNNCSGLNQSRGIETIASPGNYIYSPAAGPSSRNQSRASTYNIEDDSLQSTTSLSDSSLIDFDFSALKSNQTC